MDGLFENGNTGMSQIIDESGKRNTTGAVSIIVAEPNLLLREKIAGVLTRNNRVWCVVQVSRKDELVRAAAQINPDFILADVSILRDADAEEVLSWFSYASQIYVLVESMSGPYELLRSRLGLSGLIEKSNVADSVASEIDCMASRNDSR